MEIIEPRNSGHDFRERGGNADVAIVRHMAFAGATVRDADLVAVHLSVEGVTDGACRAAEINLPLVRIDRVDGKSLRGQPRCHGLDVGIFRAEGLAEFYWCDPLMESGRGGFMLRG